MAKSRINKVARTNPRVDAILRSAFAAVEKGDLRQAIQKFRLASRLRSTTARSMLGTLYDDLLPAPSPSKAVYWYKRGVKGGDSSCAWNLAMHHAGRRRRREYLYWLRIAASMGDVDAKREVRTMSWWKKRNLNQVDILSRI